MRTTIPITSNVRKELECRGLSLDTAFVDGGSPDTLVMVFRVGPTSGTKSANPGVVKFSKRSFRYPLRK